MFLPYSVAAYLTNMSHMNAGQRISLEQIWKALNEHSREVEHRCDTETRIKNGARVKDEYNEQNQFSNHIWLIICMKRSD